ncbi:MAG: hypothetical protein JW818_11865 [Pirellulales bacterium]|nr:hypothetical protein [Pirellulales bacterium]
MKKPKLQFDKKAVLDFLAEHGEKIAFACVACCFLYFLYAAFTLKRYAKTPNDLLVKAEQADQSIRNGESEVKRKWKDVERIIEGLIKDPVTVKPYTLQVAWNPRVPDPANRRDQPDVYPVTGLRGVAGRSSFQKANPGAGGAVGPGAMGGPGTVDTGRVGARYVLVTGAVDFQKQLNEFERRFQDTVKPQNVQLYDRPTYFFYWVRRAEVTSGADDPTKLKWEQPYRSLEAEQRRFISVGNNMSQGGDVTTANYLDQRISFPLPERGDGRPWGKEAAHVPEVPFVVSRPDAAMPGVLPTEPIDPTKPDLPKDPNKPDMPDMPAAPGMPGGPGNFAGPGFPGGEGPMPLPAPGMPHGGAMGFNPGEGGPMMPGMMGMAAESAPYKLFRFFDFNVEPGKRYRYQVRIALYNPNHKVPPQYLVDKLQKQIKEGNWEMFILSDWSEPSDEIVVPRDDRLLAVSVEQTSRKESAKVMAIHWNKKTGSEVADEFEVQPGAVVNFFKQDLPTVNTAALPVPGPMPGGEFEGLGGFGGPAPGKAPGVAAPARETIDYITDMLVMDVRGGGGLPGRNKDLKRPSEIFLLDSSGNFQVRSNVEDLEECQRLRGVPIPGPMMGPGMPPGMPVPGGPGGLHM